MLARGAAELDPGALPAWQLLAQLALDVKRPDRAAAWLREARVPPPAPRPGPRYLLAREWSAGFWSDVDHALGMCLLAEITGRTPLVWWGTQSRFSADAASNAWENFFAPVSAATLRDLQAPRLHAFPAKWQGRPLAGPITARWTGAGSRLAALDMLERDEEILVSDFHNGLKAILPWLPDTHPLAGASLADAYRSLARKYLRPHPEIMAGVERFAAAHFGAAPVLGVHVRGSDKVEEVGELERILAAYFVRVDERLARRPGIRLFLLTDDERVRAFYAQRYGDRLIATDCTRSSSNVGVHYLKSRDPVRTGIEVMLDTYLAARCTEFIGLGYSNVSLYASYLKDWPPGSCLLLDANAHEAWNALLLVMDPPPGAD